MVIPAYNEAATIADTIRSIQSQTRPPEHIIVVDDCSSDTTGEVAAAMGVQVIRPPRNQGTKAQAQNVALPFVDTEITVTIDADTALKHDALEELIKPFEKDPSLDIACGYIVPRHLRTIWERGRLVEYLYALELYKIAQKLVSSPIVCSGCFSAFRTAALRRHGGFDAGTMAEDLNFTWKVHTTGGKATFVEHAVCYPVDPPTWPVYFKQVDRWVRAFFQNLMIFWRALHRKPMLAVFIWTAVAEAFVFPLSLLVMAYVAVLGATGDYGINWTLWFLSIFGLDVFMVTAFATRGGIRTQRLAVTLRSIPLYYLLKTVNIYLWWRGFYLEVIRRQRLANWEKGH